MVSSIPVGSNFCESVVIDLAASDADWETGDIGAVAPCSSVATPIEIVFDVPRWSGEPSRDPELVTSKFGSEPGGDRSLSAADVVRSECVIEAVVGLAAPGILSVSAAHGLLIFVTKLLMPSTVVNSTTSGLVDGPAVFCDGVCPSLESSIPDDCPCLILALVIPDSAGALLT